MHLREVLFNECDKNNFNGICSDSNVWWTVAALILALAFKVSLTIVSLGISVPAGIFVPSMVCGALAGRIVGIFVESWHKAQPLLPIFNVCHPDKPCVTAGTYALLGSMAALGGVTRLTVSLTVIMFELTGTLDYIIPCMITLIVAKLVGDFINKAGLSETQIKEKNYPFLDAAQDEIIGRPALEVMTPLNILTTFPTQGITASDVERVLLETEFRGFPIVREAESSPPSSPSSSAASSPPPPFFVGYVSRRDIVKALREAQAGSVDFSPTTSVVFISHREFHHVMPPLGNTVVIPMNTTPLSVHPRAQMELVIDLFKKMGPRYLIVLERDRLVGIITKKDLLVALRNHADNFVPQLLSHRLDFSDIPLMERDSDVGRPRTRS